MQTYASWYIVIMKLPLVSTIGDANREGFRVISYWNIDDGSSQPHTKFQYQYPQSRSGQQAFPRKVWLW